MSTDANLRQRTASKEAKESESSDFKSPRERRSKKGTVEPKKKWSCGKICLFVLGGIVAFLLIVHFLPSYIQPEYVRLPSPPKLEGALAKNEMLTKAQLMLEEDITGAESMARDPVTGVIYTGTADGRIVAIDKNNKVTEIAKLGTPPCGESLEDEDNCGRPLGMRFDKDGTLVVADAYLGVHRINVKTGEFELLCRNDSVVDGPHALFLNDIAIADNGLIYVTDSSTKWQRRQVPVMFLENQSHGRLLVCDPKSRKMKTLKSGIHFANGLQLSDDQKSILIVETGMARVLRYHLSGPKSGQTEMFAENLPGFGDNIRPSAGGGYWLGLALVRSAEHFSPMDILGPLPALRCLLGEITPPLFMMEMMPEHGMVVELDKNGKIIRSLHDTTAEVVPSVSEVLDVDGTLYLGSYHSPGLMKLKLK